MTSQITKHRGPAAEIRHKTIYRPPLPNVVSPLFALLFSQPLLQSHWFRHGGSRGSLRTDSSSGAIWRLFYKIDLPGKPQLEPSWRIDYIEQLALCKHPPCSAMVLALVTAEPDGTLNTRQKKKQKKPDDLLLITYLVSLTSSQLHNFRPQTSKHWSIHLSSCCSISVV